MPLYEYRCPKCGKTKEVRHGMNEEPKQFCIHVTRYEFTGETTGSGILENSHKMEKVISAPNLIFKGSGFYATDYKNK